MTNWLLSWPETRARPWGGGLQGLSPLGSSNAARAVALAVGGALAWAILVILPLRPACGVWPEEVAEWSSDRPRKPPKRKHLHLHGCQNRHCEERVGSQPGVAQRSRSKPLGKLIRSLW